jgi:hypothetical protein
MLLYGPCATIKLRNQTPLKSTVLETFDACVGELYQRKMRLPEQLTTREWATVGPIGCDELSEIIPQNHRAQSAQEAHPQVIAWNLRILDASLQTQNYDKVLERFIRKFDPTFPTSATVGVVKGHHADHGWAVCLTQEGRRRLLRDTLHGDSDEEALWTSFPDVPASGRAKPSHVRIQVSYIFRVAPTGHASKALLE